MGTLLSYGSVDKLDFTSNFIKMFNILDSDKHTYLETSFDNLKITCYFKSEHTPNLKTYLNHFIDIITEDQVFFDIENKMFFWITEDNFEKDFRSLID